MSTAFINYSIILFQRTVSRDNIFKQAEEIVNEVGSSRAILEIQYQDEVGRYKIGLRQNNRFKEIDAVKGVIYVVSEMTRYASHHPKTLKK